MKNEVKFGAVDTVKSIEVQARSQSSKILDAPCDKNFEDAKDWGLCNTPLNNTVSPPKAVYGIDSLYYFIKSNEEYMKLFHEINIEYDRKASLTKKPKGKKNHLGVLVEILGEHYLYERSGEGFLYFRSLDNLYTIGFKNDNVNTGLHNIRVELLAFGIYTKGIKHILKQIDDKFKKYITDNKQITRIDLNCFINYDFSFVKKEKIVTKKRSFNENISIRGNQFELETLTIGSKNHKLRLYNKLKELSDKGGDKEPVMMEYFKLKGLDTLKPIWNIEFEIHREFLKSRNINTVKDALANAKKLFQYSMNAVRLTDTTISTDTKNKQRIATDKLWEYIKDNYSIDAFLQNDSELLVQRKDIIAYNNEKAKKEQFKLFRKRLEYQLPLNEKVFSDMIEEFYKSQEIPNYKELILGDQDEY